ncbi:hypothetical protein V2G26_007896 [Clonostachys chloroleuca]
MQGANQFSASSPRAFDHSRRVSQLQNCLCMLEKAKGFCSSVDAFLRSQAVTISFWACNPAGLYLAMGSYDNSGGNYDWSAHYAQPGGSSSQYPQHQENSWGHTPSLVRLSINHMHPEVIPRTLGRLGAMEEQMALLVPRRLIMRVILVKDIGFVVGNGSKRVVMKRDIAIRTSGLTHANTKPLSRGSRLSVASRLHL